MRKYTIALSIIVITLTLTYCHSSKKAATGINAVSFNQDIKPLVIQNCAPCHTGNSRKEPYDVYTNAKHDINDIIRRIELNPGEHGFMPMRKAKLSDSTIAVFKQWRDGGLKE